MTMPLRPGCDAAAAQLLTNRMRRLRLAECLKGIKVGQTCYLVKTCSGQTCVVKLVKHAVHAPARTHAVVGHYGFQDG